MAEVIACRGCRHPITADQGCALCSPVKKHLVVEGEDEETVPLAKMAGETLRLMRTDLKRLQKIQAKADEYNAAQAMEARRIAGAISKLMDSARKVIQDGVDAVEAMSFQERAELLVSWFESLPPAYRRKIFDAMVRVMGTAVEGPVPGRYGAAVVPIS